MTHLSVVVPIFNEEDNIIDLYFNIIGAMKDKLNDYEIVFVDDGSRDQSARLLNEIAQGNSLVKVIHLEQRYGMTAAIWAGIQHSEGELIALMDAGLQADPRDIFSLMPFIDKIDFVNGRWKDSKESWVNKTAYQTGNRIRTWISGDKFHDATCPLKLFKREVAESMYFFKGMHRFLPTLARMSGYSVIEVSVTHQKRKYGSPRIGLFYKIGGG